MADTTIFLFGLLVTVIVGFGLAVMIVANNRSAQRSAEPTTSEEPALPQLDPVRAFDPRVPPAARR